MSRSLTKLLVKRNRGLIHQGHPKRQSRDGSNVLRPRPPGSCA